MHPYQYLSLREPQVQDFFLGGSRSLNTLSVNLQVLHGAFRQVKQAAKT